LPVFAVRSSRLTASHNDETRHTYALASPLMHRSEMRPLVGDRRGSALPGQTMTRGSLSRSAPLACERSPATDLAPAQTGAHRRPDPRAPAGVASV